MAVRSRDWISAFVKSDKAIWSEATAEVFTVGLISVFPLIFGGIAGYFLLAINEPDTQNDFIATVWQTISSGQLLFYAISLISTVVFYATREFRNAFPLRLYYIVTSIIFIIFAAMIIGIDPSLSKLGIWQITVVSIFVYVASTAMYWSILIFKLIDPADFDGSLRRSEDAAQSDLMELRKLP